MKQRMNWSVILSNVREAREQLEQLEQDIKAGHDRSEGQLGVALEHAYHHLNTAWRARRVTTKQYANQTDAMFNRWGQFPTDFELPHLVSKHRKRARP